MPRQGLWRPAADRGRSISGAPGGIVGVIGPNGAEQDDALPHDNRAGDCAGRRRNFRIGTQEARSAVDQSRDTLNSVNTVWQGNLRRKDEIDLGRRKMASRAYCALFNFRGADQQKKSVSSQAANAIVFTSLRC
jgi:ATPase subunit of ABC transporter with duplicated ATPase domains